MKNRWRGSGNDFSAKVVLLISILGVSAPVTAAQRGAPDQRVSLDDSVILFDSSEASYVQYAAKDLGNYLTEITGKPVDVSASENAGRKAKSVIIVGRADVRSEEHTSELQSRSDL